MGLMYKTGTIAPYTARKQFVANPGATSKQGSKNPVP